MRRTASGARRPHTRRRSRAVHPSLSRTATREAALQVVGRDVEHLCDDVKHIARALLLGALSELGRATSLRELARFARIAPSSAHRIVNELVAEGLVVRQQTRGGVVVELVASQRRRIRRRYFVPPESDRQQLDDLASSNVELVVVDPKEVHALGVRRRVPTFVVTTARWAKAVSIPAPVVLLEHPHGLRQGRLAEIELLLALLKLDPLAAAEAHAFIARKPDSRRYLRRRLLKRIREEHLEKVASEAGIRLDERRRVSAVSAT